MLIRTLLATLLASSLLLSGQLSAAADAWSDTTIAITQTGARILRDNDQLPTNPFYPTATQTAADGERRTAGQSGCPRATSVNRQEQPS